MTKHAQFVAGMIKLPARGYASTKRAQGAKASHTTAEVQNGTFHVCHSSQNLLNRTGERVFTARLKSLLNLSSRASRLFLVFSSFTISLTENHLEPCSN